MSRRFQTMVMTVVRLLSQFRTKKTSPYSSSKVDVANINIGVANFALDLNEEALSIVVLVGLINPPIMISKNDNGIGAIS